MRLRYFAGGGGVVNFLWGGGGGWEKFQGKLRNVPGIS